MSLHRRLRALQRQIGFCVQHGEVPVCNHCSPTPPLPAELSNAMSDLLAHIGARFTQGELKAIVEKVVKPPSFPPCPMCGTVRYCASCGEHLTHQLFMAIKLTDEEHLILASLERRCLEMDAKSDEPPC